MGLIDSALNGATEEPGSTNDSLTVALVGPIRIWWSSEYKNTVLHKNFMAARDYVHGELGEDFLVYAPHRAFYGPWNEKIGTHINNIAIANSHALVALTCKVVKGNRYVDIQRTGTDYEIDLAREFYIPVFELDVLTPGGSNLHRLSRKVDEIKHDLAQIDRDRKAL